MLKRMKNKTILLLFVLLFSGFLITQFAYERQIKDFHTTLIQISEKDITALFLYPLKDKQEEFLLNKDGDEWGVTKGNVIAKADKHLVKQIIKTLTNVDTQDLISQDPTHWKDYGVDDTNGSRVKVLAHKTLLKDFIIGKTGRDTNYQTITYVRLTDEEEIYAVSGDLNEPFNQSFISFRNSEVLTFNPTHIQKISLVSADSSSTTYERKDSIWTLINSPIQAIHIDAYLRKIQALKGNYFADNFDETTLPSLLFQTLVLERNDLSYPLTVKIYKDSTLQYPYIIESSLNEDSYFASDSSGIYQKLVINLE